MSGMMELLRRLGLTVDLGLPQPYRQSKVFHDLVKLRRSSVRTNFAQTTLGKVPKTETGIICA